MEQQYYSLAIRACHINMSSTVKKTVGHFDVLVIGGGPAGMMAAVTAAARGKSVLLLEKNPTLGKKLLITGGGRCNVTNNKTAVRHMLGQYGAAAKFLFSAFAQHAVPDTIAWFAARGVTLVEENDGRLFPSTNSAQTIFTTLQQELKQTGVTVRTRAKVSSVMKDVAGFVVTLESGEVCFGKTCVVASGGTSRPETGSTGDGFSWLATLGHQVVPNQYTLVPLLATNEWVRVVSGVTLSNVKMTVYADTKKHSVHSGKILFTHVGLSGPTILNLSKAVGDMLQHSAVTIKIDLLPDLDAGALKLALRDLCTRSSNKMIKNALADLVPSALVTTLLVQAAIPGDTPCHSVQTPARSALAKLIAALPVHISGLQGADKAIVSSGGVQPEEINFKTMESRVTPGLFVVGDMLDINRPSGGYSLQLCWTTGFVAGEHV
jgi:predicted Rossmann fold flavoprotein